MTNMSYKSSDMPIGFEGWDGGQLQLTGIYKTRIDFDYGDLITIIYHYYGGKKYFLTHSSMN